MDEREIESLARRLGEGAEHRVDADVTAAAVMERLRADGQGRRFTSVRLWQVAAAVVALIAGGLIATQVISDGERATAALPAPAELDELAAAELVEVLDSLEYERPMSDLIPVALHDLTASELRELLQWMEG